MKKFSASGQTVFKIPVALILGLIYMIAPVFASLVANVIAWILICAFTVIFCAFKFAPAKVPRGGFTRASVNQHILNKITWSSTAIALLHTAIMAFVIGHNTHPWTFTFFTAMSVYALYCAFFVLEGGVVSSQKSLAVAQYLLEQCQRAGIGLTPMQLIKLTYVAHGYMLAATGAPLLDESVEAWQYGPVVPSVYHALKGFRSAVVAHVPGAFPNNNSINHSEKRILDFVAGRYGRYDGITLSSATHRDDTPWAITWSACGGNKNAVISNDIIKSFYSQLMRHPTHSSL